MAYAPDDRCTACGAKVDIIVTAAGRALAFDPTHVNRQRDPLAKWVTYPDPRTRTPRARKLEPREHVDFDSGEEVIRLHAAVCPAVVRGDHDS